MRRFLGSLTSSLSLSLASRLVPAALPVALLGVSGGVLIGTFPTGPVLAAAIPGTLPPISVGLVLTAEGTKDDCVATEEVEFDLAGECGLCGAADVEAGGDGAVMELIDPRCWC